MIEYDWQEKINFKSARPTGRQKFFLIFFKNLNSQFEKQQFSSERGLCEQFWRRQDQIEPAWGHNQHRECHGRVDAQAARAAATRDERQNNESGESGKCLSYKFSFN